MNRLLPLLVVVVPGCCAGGLAPEQTEVWHTQRSTGATACVGDAGIVLLEGVGSNSLRAIGVDRGTGEERWRGEAAEDVITDDDCLAVFELHSSDDGLVFTERRAKDGQEVRSWTSVEAPDLATWRVTPDAVFGLHYHDAVRVDRATGQIHWQVSWEDGELEWIAAPATVGDWLVTPCTRGEAAGLCGISAEGEVHVRPGEVFAVAAADGDLFLATPSALKRVGPPPSWDERWTVDAPTTKLRGKLLAEDDRLLALTGKGDVLSLLDASSGSEIWSETFSNTSYGRSLELDEDWVGWREDDGYFVRHEGQTARLEKLGGEVMVTTEGAGMKREGFTVSPVLDPPHVLSGKDGVLRWVRLDFEPE